MIYEQPEKRKLPPFIDPIICQDCWKRIGWNNTKWVNAETAALCDECLEIRIKEDDWR